MADWREFARQTALTQGVDPSLVLPLINIESGGQPNVVSPKGAAGIMQLMPGTARGLGLSDADRFNPAKAIPAGISYLKQQLDKYQDPAKALAAYNAGPRNVDKYGGVPPFKETQNYVRKNAMAQKGTLSVDDADTLLGGSPKRAAPRTLSIDEADALLSAKPVKTPLKVIDNAQAPGNPLADVRMHIPLVGDVSPPGWLGRGIIGAGKAGTDFLEGIGLADNLGLQSLPPARAVKPNLSSLITGQAPQVSPQQQAANALESDPAAIIGNILGQAGITYAGGRLLGGTGGLAKTGAAASRAVSGANVGRGTQLAEAIGQGLQTAGRAATNPQTILQAIAAGSTMGAISQPGDLAERAKNALAGGTGGAGGYGLASLIGKAVQPVKNQLGEEASRVADLARSMGINLTPAQQTGSKPLQILDSVLANLPFSASKIQSLRSAQQQAINRAAGKTFGASAGELSPQVIDDSFERIGNEFSRLTTGKQIPLDNQFVNDLARVDAMQSALPPSMRDSKAASVVNDFLDLAGQGQVEGSVYQKMRSALSKQAKDAAASGNNTLKESLQGLRDALDDAASRSMNATDAQAWQLARRQYGNLKTLTKGNVIDEAGNIQPGRLAQAVRTKNKDAYARGKAGDLDEVARVAKMIVREPIPDSGTAGRTAMQNLLTGSAVGAGLFNPLAFAMLPVPRLVAGAVHSPAMQAYLTRGAVNPNSALVPIGQALGQRLPLLGAAMGAPVAGGLLGQ